jgi:hypothetical protein
MQIYCPFDTQDLINRNEISNFALRYQRFLENEVGNGGTIPSPKKVDEIG